MRIRGAFYHWLCEWRKGQRVYSWNERNVVIVSVVIALFFCLFAFVQFGIPALDGVLRERSALGFVRAAVSAVADGDADVWRDEIVYPELGDASAEFKWRRLRQQCAASCPQRWFADGVGRRSHDDG